MKIAIVGCANLKMPTRCPAWLMYSSSPLFSQRYLIAKQSGLPVFILSGLYGLIDPEKIIEPYDKKIEISDTFLTLLGTQRDSMGLKEAEIDSYCSAIYNQGLEKVFKKINPLALGNLIQVAKTFGVAGTVKGNVFPIRQGIVWVYENSPVSFRDWRYFCASTWKHPTTQKCQYERLIKSSFVEVKNGKIYYAF